MILVHRELLARLAAFNRGLPGIILDLTTRQDGGELPAEGLRYLGRALAVLSADCLALADGQPINRLIIDARRDCP